MLSQGRGQERGTRKGYKGGGQEKGDQGVKGGEAWVEEVQPTFCFGLYSNLGPTLLTVAMTHSGGEGGGGKGGEEEQEGKGRRWVRWEEGERVL